MKSFVRSFSQSLCVFPSLCTVVKYPPFHKIIHYLSLCGTFLYFCYLEGERRKECRERVTEWGPSSSLHPVLSLPVYPTSLKKKKKTFSIINAQIFLFKKQQQIKPRVQQLCSSQEVNRTQQCVVCL